MSPEERHERFLDHVEAALVGFGLGVAAVVLLFLMTAAFKSGEQAGRERAAQERTVEQVPCAWFCECAP